MTNSQPLSKQQRIVAIKVASGRSNSEIGGELFVSEDTVKTHVRRAMLLTNTGSRNGLALYAVYNLLTDDQRRTWRASERGQASAAAFTTMWPRERDIMELLLREPDVTNSQIGQRLLISEDTVKTHLRRLAQRMQVVGRNTRVVLTVRYALVHATQTPKTSAA